MTWEFVLLGGHSGFGYFAVRLAPSHGFGLSPYFSHLTRISNFRGRRFRLKPVTSPHKTGQPFRSRSLSLWKREAHDFHQQLQPRRLGKVLNQTRQRIVVAILRKLVSVRIDSSPLQLAQDLAKRVAESRGSRLDEWAGQGNPAQGGYAGRPGAIFARVLADDEGNVNVPFWRATRIISDSRIRPKKTITLEFVFELSDPKDEPGVEAKLIYRPVVKPLAERKGWKAEDIEIATKAW